MWTNKDMARAESLFPDETTAKSKAVDVDKRTYFEIPEGISEMSDEEISEWSKNVYRQFVSLNPAPSAEMEEGGKA